MIGKFPQSIKTVFESSERHCNTFFSEKGSRNRLVHQFLYIYTMLFLYTYTVCLKTNLGHRLIANKEKKTVFF